MTTGSAYLIRPSGPPLTAQTSWGMSVRSGRISWSEWRWAAIRKIRLSKVWWSSDPSNVVPIGQSSIYWIFAFSFISASLPSKLQGTVSLRTIEREVLIGPIFTGVSTVSLSVMGLPPNTVSIHSPSFSSLFRVSLPFWLVYPFCLCFYHKNTLGSLLSPIGFYYPPTPICPLTWLY